MSSASGGLKVLVSIDVDADLAGVRKGDYIEALTRRLEGAVGDGLLTGHSVVEVDRWQIKVEALEEPEKNLSEAAVAEWLMGLMMSGSMSLEDVPKLMARYALSSEASMRAELAERMGLV